MNKSPTVSPAKHHTSTSMLHRGNTKSAIQFPLGYCSFFVFLGPSASLLLIGLPLLCFLYSNSTMKPWLMQSPANSRCWDVSATWTLGSIDVGSNLSCLQLAIFKADNSDEVILCSRGNSRSALPGAVLKGTSFIIAFDCFCDCTCRNLQSSWNFPDWLTFIF